MYQSIDDEFDDDEEIGGLSPWPFVWGGVAAAFVFALVWLSSPGTPVEPGRSVSAPGSDDAYRAAISAPTAAMRRARLLDYQTMNPDDGNARRVQAQLDVIAASEAAAWERTLRAAYDVRATTEEKIAAVQAYAADWPPALLGGRGEEIETLMAEIKAEGPATEKPDRSLPDIPSAIPDNIPSGTLAGGPRQVEVYVSPAPPPPVPVVRAPVSVAPVIVPPKVRRNVSPRYPRKAMRKNIDAVVTLALDIDDEGRVALTEVISVEAERYAKDFVKASERAALRTRFEPQTVDGKPVAVRGIRKRYRFKSK